MATEKGDKIRYYIKVHTEKKYLLAILISVACYFTWFYSLPLFGPILSNYLANMKALAIEGGSFLQLFLISMLVSSLLSGFLVDKLKKRVLLIWVSALLSSIITISYIYLNTINDMFILSILTGFVAGINPPAWGAFIADHTSSEDRGRVLGLPIGLSMFFTIIFRIQNPLIGTSITNELIIVSIVAFLPLLTLILKLTDIDLDSRAIRRERHPKMKQILFYASPMLLFYWVAGVLFSIVIPTILDHISETTFFGIWGVPFLIGAIVGGVIFDTVGRKFPAIVGLAITGVSLAVFGIFGIRSGYLLLIPLAFGFSMITVFSFIVWADLAPSRARGVYYGIGTALVSLALLIGLVSAGSIFGSISASQINIYILASSVALFLCIPPLLMAEELLPKEVIEKREYNEYLEQAKKKYGNKD